MSIASRQKTKKNHKCRNTRQWFLYFRFCRFCPVWLNFCPCERKALVMFLIFIPLYALCLQRGLCEVWKVSQAEKVGICLSTGANTIWSKCEIVTFFFLLQYLQNRRIFIYLITFNFNYLDLLTNT